jgi:RecA-family ATPase
MLSGVGEGSRNDACARLAGYYAGKGIPLDVALALLDSWNNQNKPPLSTTELETTTRSVYRTAYKSSSNSTNTNTNTNTNMNNTVEQTKQEAFKVVDVNTYMTKHGTGSVSWVINDWLPDETIAFLVSPPGSFKTWMLLDLAVSVAGGTPFLNQFEVNSTGPVLIVQQEDFHGELAERLAVIINNRYNLISQKGDDWQIKMPPNLPIYLHPERRLRFDNPEVMKAFMATVGELRPKLVIIDPLYSTGTMDDYMTKIAELMFPLKRLRDEYCCSFILAHHTKKSAEGNGREGLWGSQFLNAFL